MRQRRSIEFWRDIRGLVEKGLSLKKAAGQFGVSYSHLSQKASAEGWRLVYRGRPRRTDYPNGERRAEMATEEARYEEARALVEREAEVLVIDAKKAELVAQKVLSTHSTKLKVLLSEWAVRTAESVQNGDIRLRDQAAAMLAVRAIGNQLYGWDSEPNIAQLQQARHGAINLELIRMSPAQLEQLPERAKPLEAEFNDVGKEAPGRAALKERPAGGGCQSVENEAPRKIGDSQCALHPVAAGIPTAGGRARPSGSVDPRGLSRDGQCVPDGHPPHARTVQTQEGNPALFGVSEEVLEKHRQQLQELDRARQVWRSGCRR